MMEPTVAGKTYYQGGYQAAVGSPVSIFHTDPGGDSMTVSGQGIRSRCGTLPGRCQGYGGKKMTYDKITGFYYPGTTITEIKNARMPVRP